jgi:hypothetical protein
MGKAQRKLASGITRQGTDAFGDADLPQQRLCVGALD